MRITNIHQRALSQPVDLLAVAGPNDPVWPYGRWPRMKFDRGLVVGARGGHGPVRYVVEEVSPSRLVFRFTPPDKGFAAGLHGTHRFEYDGTTLRHVIEAEAGGLAWLKWQFIIRPLHDALVEEALAKAAGAERRPDSLWVKLLRGRPKRNRAQAA